MAHSAIFSSWNLQVGGSEVDSLDQKVGGTSTTRYGSLYISLKDNCVLYRLIGTLSVFVINSRCCAASTYTFAVFLAVTVFTGL